MALRGARARGLTGPIDLYERFSEIKGTAKDWLKTLGKNGYEHSERVEHYLAELTKKLVERDLLTQAEIFVLLCAAYLHDLGYWHDGHLEVKGHPERSRQLIEDTPATYLLGDFPSLGGAIPGVAQAVGWVSYGHCEETYLPLAQVPNSFADQSLSSEILNLRKLSALLRLADEADDPYIRLSEYEAASIRSMTSLVKIGEETIRWYWKETGAQDPGPWVRHLKEKQRVLATSIDYLRDLTKLGWYLVLEPQVPDRTYSSQFRAVDSLDTHYETIVKTLAEGRVVPFLGEGANLCGRPAQKKWQYGQPDTLPSNAELAEHLARNFEYPANAPLDLLRVSQYVSMVRGSGPLYEELHTLFDTDYRPTPLHHYFAALPRVLREKGYPPRYPLIVTTNFDDALERAFRDVNEPFDLVAYVAEGEQRGKFLHVPQDGGACVIERPNEYRGLALEQRSVILKIHGAVDRDGSLWDSFAITEDHYINYLVRTDISNLLPVMLAAKLRKSHFLFLGYSLRDWNLRVILHRIWGEQKLSYKSWAIQEKLDLMEKDFWRKREVDVFTVPLGEYIAEIEQRLRELPRRGGP